MTLNKIKLNKVRLVPRRLEKDSPSRSQSFGAPLLTESMSPLSFIS